MEGKSSDKLMEGAHPSVLPTEPTDAPHGYIGTSADRLADGENSLFDKGLIDTQ